MILLERMVLLLLEAAGAKSVPEANLQSVCSVMDRRYDLMIRPEPKRITEVLESMTRFNYIRRHGHGYRLDTGGQVQLQRIRRQQGAFCRKFREDVSSINPLFATST